MRLIFLLVCLSPSLFGVDGWRPELSLQTSSLHRVVPSPDGATVLIELGQAHVEKNRPVRQLFIARADGSGEPLPLTPAEESCFRCSWSPDGRWISFLSNRGDGVQLYLVPTNGGEAIQRTHMSENIETYLWSPDSQAIAFTAREESPSPYDGVILVDDPNFPRRALWVVDVGGSQPVRLTDRRYNVRGCGDFANDSPDFDWSPDGQEITFAHSPRPEFDTTYVTSSLSTLNLLSGRVVDWEAIYPHSSQPRYSPDGQWIAFLHGTEPNSWSATTSIALRSRLDGEVSELAPTPNEGHFLGFSPVVGWLDGDFLMCDPSGTRFSLVALPSDGSEGFAIDDGKTFFSSATLNGRVLGLVVQAPDRLPEAFVTQANRFAPVQLSRFNEWAQQIPIGETQKVRWSSIDGLEIEGLLTLPRGYREGRPVPLLLLIHGGPMGFHMESSIALPSRYSIAAFAEAGFAVLRPNPRGSCGYGKQFRCLNYRDWGGLDYCDLIAGVDALVARGVADPERLGVMGWSYGGYMTMWAVSQTDRFQAASAGAGISDIADFFGTSDIPSFATDYFGGEPWKQAALYCDRSPLTHIDKAATPCLLQHGLDDLRVPFGQSVEFYRSLKGRGVETQLILYPRCGHDISEPKQLLDSMERNLEWFVDKIGPCRA